MLSIEGRRPRVCVDPGHGGKDPGTSGANGTREADVVLAVAKELVYQLETLGIDGYLTRTADEYVGLSERTDAAKDADCFISIHCNGFRDPRVHGLETLYPKPGGVSKALANNVHQSVRALSERDRGIKMSPGPQYGRNLWVLRMAPCPVCLVELDFLTNPEREAKYSDPSFQKDVAHKLAQGINSWLRSQPWAKQDAKASNSKPEPLKRDPEPLSPREDVEAAARAETGSTAVFKNTSDEKIEAGEPVALRDDGGVAKAKAAKPNRRSRKSRKSAKS